MSHSYLWRPNLLWPFEFPNYQSLLIYHNTFSSLRLCSQFKLKCRIRILLPPYLISIICFLKKIFILYLLVNKNAKQWWQHAIYHHHRHIILNFSHQCLTRNRRSVKIAVTPLMISQKFMQTVKFASDLYNWS